MFATTRFARVGALASKSRNLLGARSLATVSENPLDKKVEMCNYEKVRFSRPVDLNRGASGQRV
ncbi:hypothetical protein PABG_11956 [Paracoccidioides brasiliensis Pb03]|uniref:Uncharacterized protein n=2 Tax=Paracoccidioides brasiliensis TaxID=121759 RepID=A0A0A0HTT1_PARBD|nr:uncharacterized protein PADG_11844 [Paracoccidioides brasiliensis Pb18]KGM92052.1 hypothetical protein PADG_11844 [Paracoccidioides brasiliensis Pb18]KGY15172.1 hypothetical protein PABG_11956 [Paracoccidioides brasiliensis Pb03]ODH39520.1 hypothetical protein ACO22_01857 [Paracoccidioides brasiliensis]ODH51360.1 hypothetical protein GX48_02416 [Paracoccidioides brasiliensis]